MGTVHQPIESFNPDSLYNILVRIDPDVILVEGDTSFFTSDFQFSKRWESNENIATIKYMNSHDVDVRPYDFTGRNEHRIKIGSRPTDSKATELLDSLYTNKLLLEHEKEIYKTYLVLTDSLNIAAYIGPKAFNNSYNDSIASIRQFYQYTKLLEIMKNKPVFSTTYHKINDTDSISYAEGYKRASEFWNLRNNTMAKHILYFVNEYPGKRIIVLNGYYHRYYLMSLLKPKQQENNFVIRNFDEY